MMHPRTPPHLIKQANFFTDASPAHTESSVAATSLSSGGHNGPHRSGFSVKKCRDVLVRQCGWIPRNYNFKDGVNQVYEVLREYLGDENLDLAIAQLNELIEVPSQWPHDEGASFQAWKHDYMLRHKDFENSHVPRLKNIIVAPVNPTERLKEWREAHLAQQLLVLSGSQSSRKKSSNNEIRPPTPDYGIGIKVRGGNWRLENALFVSSRAQGTRVLHCPSAQELHTNTWNEEFGRGGKLVHERIVYPGESVDVVDHTTDQAISLRRKISVTDLRSIRSFADLRVPHRIQSIKIIPKKLQNSLRRKFSSCGGNWYTKQASNRNERPARTRHYHLDPLIGRFANEVKAYEDDPVVRKLPDPDSNIGKPYYSKITTWPLPPGTCVPSPRFARKHELVSDEMPLPGGVVIMLVPTADEVAIEKNFQDGLELNNSSSHVVLGPFTPELFKDGGIDFPQNWGDMEHVPTVSSLEVGALTDLGTLGDAAHSPSKDLKPICNIVRGSSSYCTETDSEQQYPAHPPNELFCTLLKARGAELSNFLPCTMQHSGRSWYCSRLELCHKPAHSYKTQSSFRLYRSWISAVIPSMNSKIMEFTISVWTVTMRMSRRRTLSGDNSEFGKKPELALRWALPDAKSKFSVNGAKDCSIDTHDREKAFARKVHQVHQTSILVAEHLMVVGIMNNFEGKLLDCGSLGVTKETRLQSDNENNSTNKKIAQALGKCEQNKLKLFSGILSQGSFEGSLTLIHKTEELRKICFTYEKLCEMDLNRDLPPLPFTTGYKHLKFGDQIHQQSSNLGSFSTIELLQPFSYDPIRDSLKYGGFHYHPDGMHYHPEVPQHPPRTSSLVRADGSSASSIGPTINELVSGDHVTQSSAANSVPQDVFGSARAYGAKYGSEVSSGFLGNFIPVKTVAPSSVITTRSVHVPRIETDCSLWATNQNPKPNISYEKATSQVPTCSPKNQNNGNLKGKYFEVVTFQNVEGGSVVRNTDHHSIDVDDPEALDKYIRYLKMMKKQNIGAKKQSFKPSSSLSEQIDEEVDNCIDNIDIDHDCNFVGSSEATRTSRLIAQDYSEIRAGNPFESDTDHIHNDLDSITTFTDFIGTANSEQEQSAKKGHLKNSHSESTAFYMKKLLKPIQVAEHNNLSRQMLQRSDSSPSYSTQKVVAPHGGAGDWDSRQSSYKDDDLSCHQTFNCSRHLNNTSRNHIHGHRLQNTPPGRVGDVPDCRETAVNTLSPNQKRPWSPMKMVFGEGSWLNSTAISKDESTTPKRAGLVEKIKLKIEEIGLKTDFSPKKYPFGNNHDKSLEQSTFPISLSPLQQAELYLDIELLICDSANTFLMNEYNNGRMSVESLKKVTDFWRSKGRPQVVEFHYDQTTQRDLIVANQKTFHFYGPNAGNTLKVHSMLYAWKTNAREMAVRTFCYPDSMIRKHIGDAFVILDFLGGHPFQYIAAHEVQKKLVRWINEAQVRLASRSSGLPEVQKGGYRSSESPTEMVMGNPWHSASKPSQRSNKQNNSFGEDQLLI